MNRQQILFSLALRELGLPLTVKQFNDRLVIQKAVCLLQFAGVNIGYRFQWYLHGPYSSELASDAFWLASLSQFVEEELKAWKLDEASRQRILDIKSLFDCTQVAKLAKQLELLASVLFIVRTGQANGDDHQRIAQLLQANKKPFSLRDVSGGAATLRKYGISL